MWSWSDRRRACGSPSRVLFVARRLPGGGPRLGLLLLLLGGAVQGEGNGRLMLWNDEEAMCVPVSRLGYLACSVSVPQDAAGDSVFEHIRGHMTGAHYSREDQLFNQKSDTPETP